MENITPAVLTPIFNRKGQTLVLKKSDKWFIPQFDIRRYLILSQAAKDIIEQQLGLPITKAWSPISNIYRLTEMEHLKSIKVSPAITDIEYIPRKNVNEYKWTYIKNIDDYDLPKQIKDKIVESFYHIYKEDEFASYVNPSFTNSDIPRGINY